jgi:hypothetical protein
MIDLQSHSFPAAGSNWTQAYDHAYGHMHWIVAFGTCEQCVWHHPCALLSASVRCRLQPGTVSGCVGDRLVGSLAYISKMIQSLWIFAGEIFPTSHRASGLGFVTSFTRVGSTVSLFIAYMLYDANPASALWVCCACCAAVRVFLRYITTLVTQSHARSRHC